MEGVVFVIIYDYDCGFSIFSCGHQWIVSMAMFMPSAWASSFPSHFDDFASSDEPNMMSRLGGKLQCMRFIGQVRGEE